MPRTKIKYEPIDQTIHYTKDQWDIFHSKRNLAKFCTAPLQSAGFDFLVYGSIARGDVKTISLHLHELSLKNQSLVSVYRTMGLCAAEIANRKRTLTSEKAAEIKTLLLTLE